MEYQAQHHRVSNFMSEELTLYLWVLNFMFKGSKLIPQGIKLYVQRAGVNTFGYRRCYLEISSFMSEELTLIPWGIGVDT